MSVWVESIRQGARQLVRELHLLDGRHCIEGFSLSECHLITELERLGEATAGDLGQILVLEKSTMSRLVNGLLQRNYIESRADPKDRRRRLLRLTGKGKQGAERVHRVAREQVFGALEIIDEPAAREIAASLQRYANGLKYARLGKAFVVRPIEARDNPAVAQIIREVMTEYAAVGPEYSISDPEVDAMFEAYCGRDCRFYVVARQGGPVLGCGGIAPLRGADDDVCELQKMYFLPALRGTGMGARLLKRLLDDARQLGYRQCYLETLDRMVEARHLYTKYGFQSIDTPMGCTGHSGCNAWMVRTL